MVFNALFSSTKTLLSPELEQRFQVQQMVQGRRAAEHLLIYILVIMVAFSALDYLSGHPDSFVDKSRFISAIPILFGAITSRFVPVPYLLRYWLALSAVLLVTAALFFAVVADYFGYLQEGGPMLAVLFVAVIPFFNARHKLMLWSLFVGILLVAQPWVSGSLFWSISDSAFTAALMLFMQVKLDRLQRFQFKNEYLEAQKAMTDQLTGIYNRRGFEMRVEKLLSSLEDDQSLALAFLDIDYFKQYNDNYGHLEGDQVLQQLAQILVKMEFELVVRFGGEEFIVIERFHGESAKRIPEICDVVMAAEIPHEFSLVADVITVSGGVCTMRETADRPSVSAMLRLADERLYAAKDQGRNRIVTIL